MGPANTIMSFTVGSLSAHYRQVTDLVATLMQSMLGSLRWSHMNTGELLPLRERPLVLHLNDLMSGVPPLPNWSMQNMQQSDLTISCLAVPMDAVFRVARAQQESAN